MSNRIYDINYIFSSLQFIIKKHLLTIWERERNIERKKPRSDPTFPCLTKLLIIIEILIKKTINLIIIEPYGEIEIGNYNNIAFFFVPPF